MVVSVVCLKISVSARRPRPGRSILRPANFAGTAVASTGIGRVERSQPLPTTNVLSTGRLPEVDGNMEAIFFSFFGEDDEMRDRKLMEMLEMAGLFRCFGKDISPQTRTDKRRVASHGGHREEEPVKLAGSAARHSLLIVGTREEWRATFCDLRKISNRRYR